MTFTACHTFLRCPRFWHALAMSLLLSEWHGTQDAGHMALKLELKPRTPWGGGPGKTMRGLDAGLWTLDTTVKPCRVWTLDSGRWTQGVGWQCRVTRFLKIM